MTREEAVKIFNTVLFFGRCDCQKEEIEECLRMAIKALEQEPFINKSCVAQGSCDHDKNEVLDKIREEIRHFMMEVNPSSSESDYACNYIIGILDKYKSESEDDDG